MLNIPNDNKILLKDRVFEKKNSINKMVLNSFEFILIKLSQNMLSKQIREVRNFQYTQSFHDSEVILKSGRNGLILQIHHQHLTGDI